MIHREPGPAGRASSTLINAQAATVLIVVSFSFTLNPGCAGMICWIVLLAEHHGFTLRSGMAHVHMVSNVQRADSMSFAQRDTFEISSIATRNPRIVITWQPQAVKQSRRAELLEMLKAADPKAMRLAVGLSSREAAPLAGGSVSEQCFVAHLLPDGSGEVELFGRSRAEFVPTLIVMGQLPEVQGLDVLESRRASEGPQVVYGATWSVNHSEMAAMIMAIRSVASHNQKDRWRSE